MTSTNRPVNASLAVPATQNTAPILEFRCLYTHDLRQKKKRWQDGFLRFHTFNKRVMVYDIERNFIGDSHWREDGAVQDGDELKLDKGVLIQVGEETGRTEQDRTELLEKIRPAQDISPRNIVRPSSGRQGTARSDASALSQLRPKSLNALLGTPRGAYGRAILPTKSRYDDRNNENRQFPEAERPLKRQRVDADGVFHNATALDTSKLTTPRAQPVKQMTKGVRTTSSLPKKPTSHPLIVVDSDTESEMPSSPAKRPEQSIRLKSNASDKPVRVAMKPQKSTRKPADSPAPLMAIAPMPPIVAISSRRKATGIGTDSRKEEDRPINPLRIASGKGRKKLMYRELLPKIMPSLPACNNDKNNDSPTAEKRNPRKSRKSSISEQIQPLDDLEVFRRGQQDLLQGKLAKCRTRQKSATPDYSNINTGDHDRLEYTDGIPSQRATAQLLMAQDVVDSCEEDKAEESLFVSQEPPPEKDWLSKMDQILIVQPDPPPIEANDYVPPPQSPKGRSHANALTNAENLKAIMNATTIERQVTKRLDQPAIPDLALPKPQLPPAPVPRRSPFHKALSASNATAPSIRAPPSRSFSDLTNSRSVPAGKPITRPRITAPSPDLDLGPWSREAFDLFGWRPGEEKIKAQLQKVAPI
ncbi:hypothetical protein MMC17_008652 [Xylographa soralifera]|nr:hypothetical protein [Xylographa soralifera]